MIERPSLCTLAAAHCRQGRCESAIRLLEQILRRRPGDAEVHYELGVCYSGGCREHSLTRPELAIEHFREALRLTSGARQKARILSALGFVHARVTGSCRDGLLCSIDCHERAADLYWGEKDLESWSREQHNLGNVWCQVPASVFPDKWSRAVEHYENALVVRTREKNPEEHAATLQNLGTAYRELPAEEKGSAVRKAIHCYRKALEVCTAASHPVKHATLRNNLGNAYLALSQTDPACARKNVLRACHHYQRALNVLGRRQDRSARAVTCFNCGTAMMILSLDDPDPVRCRQEAVLRFRQAEECWTRCRHPELAAAARARRRKIEHSCGEVRDGSRDEEDWPASGSGSSARATPDGAR